MTDLEADVHEEPRHPKFDPGEPYRSRLIVHIAGAISRSEWDECYLVLPRPKRDAWKPSAIVVHRDRSFGVIEDASEFVVHEAVVDPDGRVSFVSGGYFGSTDLHAALQEAIDRSSG